MSIYHSYILRTQMLWILYRPNSTVSVFFLPSSNNPLNLDGIHCLLADKVTAPKLRHAAEPNTIFVEAYNFQRVGYCFLCCNIFQLYSPGICFVVVWPALQIVVVCWVRRALVSIFVYFQYILFMCDVQLNGIANCLCVLYSLRSVDIGEYIV